MRKLQVIVCQHGARRRYAVPRMLEEAGILCALYTDSSSHSLVGRFASFLGLFAFEKAKRLADRKILGIAAGKIFSSDILLFDEMAVRLTSNGSNGIRKYQRQFNVLSRRMKKWGVRDGNVVYSMFYEHIEFLKWARLKGLKSVVDVYVNPLAERIVLKEFQKYPSMGQVRAHLQNEIVLREKLWADAARLADLLLCPSEYVAEGVRELNPLEAGKITIVPYGCSMDYKGEVNEPVPGRLLFVGNDAVRKGLLYLVEAVDILRREFVTIDARVVGDIAKEITGHENFKGLNFLGKMSSQELMKEYLAADVFTLPSLSEGFAGVAAEAIAAGCPVVVTKESGSPVINGREGIVVPSGDSISLAVALKKMVTDRPFRSQCSQNCLQQKTFYSEKSWQKRLIASLNKLAKH